MKCVVCGKEIPLDEGYFEENGKIYCEKDYAEKRYSEVDRSTKLKWLKMTLDVVKAELRGIPDEEKPKIKAKWKKKIPKAWEKKVDEL